MAEGPNKEAEEWEKRLISGDLPEDFLQVTEPKVSGNEVTATATATLTTIQTEGPVSGSGVVATANLVDLGAAQPAVDPAQSDGKPEEPVGRDPNQSAHTEEETERPMTTEEKDHAMALALQRQLNMEGQEQARANAAAAAVMSGYAAQPPPNAIGRMTVTVAEAKLARNYGMTRMDPYCRVRIGHCVYETPTAANGAREPKWNKTFNCYLLAGVKTMDIEVYDECTFHSDTLIAHTSFPVPDAVLSKFEVVDDWWPLSGQEGHDKEGMLHLILSLQPISASATAAAKTIAVMPGQKVRIPLQQPAPKNSGDPAPVQQEQEQQQPTVELGDEQLEEFCSMFPNLDKEVIISVFQENRGNQDSTVNGLLLLSGS